ncbi:glycosyl hydrolase [Catenulispora rubra]|uniref:glycosyl hydrolase n=1 Tax=Catenulispora rubra TaxID=280293 RepID=UPI00189273E0
MRTATRLRLLPIGAACAALAMVLAGPQAAADNAGATQPHNRPHAVKSSTTASTGHIRSSAVGGPPGNPDGGVDDPTAADNEYFAARSAPGIVAPGAYGAAWQQIQSMPHYGPTWKSVTTAAYNSDDPLYRDYDSNSSGGAGNVTGRMTGMAADNAGHIYAGGANGGVWRSSTGGGQWTPISEALPAASTGDLELDASGRLWYATGEANTASDTFTGSGVYVLSHPVHGTFSTHDRVGGTELQSTSIRKIRFIGGTVYAATTRGLYSHPLSDLHGAWKLEFAPNPTYLPGGSQATDPAAPYKNIVNDVTADPTDPSKLIAAIGWRSGDTYNGFYTKSGGTWTRITTSLGDLPTAAANVGAVTFARSVDGSKFYAINQDPTKISSAQSTLGGVYVSNGTPFGPWSLIADSPKLEASGSAETGATYNPGVQAWYNQFLQVDPTDPNHVYMGLEEVYESHDAGATWNTVGPYWNFTYPCWSIDPTKQTGTCSPTTHSDQHAVAIGSMGGKAYVVVGNDGGVYKRPVAGVLDSGGHAADWQSLNDGTIDTLQYYSVGVGADPSGKGVAVSGGLQDNGQSILRSGPAVMGSNFGGDGGDTLVDPANGCNIAQEYTNENMWVTNDCGQNVSTDPSTSTEYNVPPNDGVNGTARFTAPFTADIKNPNTWVAGGQHVAVQTKGFAIRATSDWTDVYDLGTGHLSSAVASSGGKIYAAWCGGGCNSVGFSRGIAVGNADGTGWHQLTLPTDGTSLPNRYLSSIAIDPSDANHVYVAVSGFSRKWTEGPGADFGHIFESHDGGTTWKDISANLPDVPADSIQILPHGGIALATDLGVFYEGAHSSCWSILGNGLPTNATLQLQLGPDGNLYAATHGRGIWKIRVPSGGQNQQ